MLKRWLAFAVLILLCANTDAASTRLTALERSQGWRLLFDGESLNDWRGFKTRGLPGNWHVRDGSLCGFAGPAIVSVEEFGDFELSFEWRVVRGGHGEVYFHVGEESTHPEESGPVMELAGHGAVAGTNSGLVKPERKVAAQFDAWQRARIVVFGDLAEYFIGGERVLSCVLGSAAWRDAVANSRFAAFPNFALYRRGAFALSGEGVEFRHIKVRSRDPR